MNDSPGQPVPLDVQAVSDLYQRAAQELLHAYQRNKEATRHHARGAFRAALHHARLSCAHSSAAHEYLAQALQKSDRLSSLPWLPTQAVLTDVVHKPH